MPRDYGTEVDAAWAEVDAAMTAAGTRVQGLIDQINATPGDGLNGPQTEKLLSNLATLRDHLNATGVNSTIPPTPDLPPIV